MSYPGTPPNEQQPSGGGPYGFPDANVGSTYPPAPGQAPDYGQPANQVYTTEPVSPAYGAPTQQVGQVSPGYSPDYGQPVPQQPAPMHDQGAYGAPAYAQGTAQMPVYADPNATGYAPYGAPMSGPPLGQPSGPPVSGMPGGYGQPPAPAAKRSVAVPILASLLALAVIAAGIFIGLYVSTSSDLSKSKKLAAEQQATISSTNAELDKTKKDLAAKTDELTQAQQDLRGSKNDSDQAKKERDVIAKCLTLLTQALTAANAGDKATTQAKIDEMKAPCDQAYSIIGI